MLLLCRFDVSDDHVADFISRAEHVLRLLTAQPGCDGGQLCRATEGSSSWVLSARFASVADYRRSMSGFEVREHVIALLSQARVDEPSAYESIITSADGQCQRYDSLLAKDAGTVALGDAAGRADPR